MMGRAVELGMSFNLTSHSVSILIKQFRLHIVSLNVTCSAGRTVNCFSHVHPSKFSLKQVDVSAPFLFKCAYVYTINELQANQKVLKLNGMVWIVFCANGANLLGANRYNVCRGNGQGHLLVGNNEVSLVTNLKVKGGTFTTQSG
jgi:hypothetical protein